MLLGCATVSAYDLACSPVENRAEKSQNVAFGSGQRAVANRVAAGSFMGLRLPAHRRARIPWRTWREVNGGPLGVPLRSGGRRTVGAALAMTRLLAALCLLEGAGRMPQARQIRGVQAPSPPMSALERSKQTRGASPSHRLHQDRPSSR